MLSGLHGSPSATRIVLMATCTGTYIIDAELPGHPLKNTVMGNNVIPNASFETVHGAISLNLATAGGTNVPNKTYVRVASRHGKVNVNLVSPTSSVSWHPSYSRFHSLHSSPTSMFASIFPHGMVRSPLSPIAN